MVVKPVSFKGGWEKQILQRLESVCCEGKRGLIPLAFWRPECVQLVQWLTSVSCFLREQWGHLWRDEGQGTPVEGWGRGWPGLWGKACPKSLKESWRWLGEILSRQNHSHLPLEGGLCMYKSLIFKTFCSSYIILLLTFADFWNSSYLLLVENIEHKCRNTDISIIFCGTIF